MVDVLSKDYKIILLTKNIYINYYKNYLNRNIEIIGYDWDKFEKLRKKSILKRFFITVRKLSSGKKYTNNTTNKVREIQYKYLLKKQKFFFYFCLFTSKFLNFSKYFRMIFNYLEKLSIDTKYFDNLLNFYKPNAVIIGSCCIDHRYLHSISAKIKYKTRFYFIQLNNQAQKVLQFVSLTKFFMNQVMTKDIENFNEIEKKDISECGILHWSNYKEKLTPLIDQI